MSHTITISLLLRRTPLLTAIALAVLGFALVLPAHAQDLARRLILKDGSYQVVTK